MFKEGRVLSQANYNKIKKAQELLSELIEKVKSVEKKEVEEPKEEEIEDEREPESEDKKEDNQDTEEDLIEVDEPEEVEEDEDKEEEIDEEIEEESPEEDKEKKLKKILMELHQETAEAHEGNIDIKKRKIHKALRQVKKELEA